MGTGIFAVEQKNKVLCFNYLCAHRPLDCPQILRRRQTIEWQLTNSSGGLTLFDILRQRNNLIVSTVSIPVGGLVRFNISSKRARIFTPDPNILSLWSYSIQQDESSRIWAHSTANALSNFPGQNIPSLVRCTLGRNSGRAEYWALPWQLFDPYQLKYDKGGRIWFANTLVNSGGIHQFGVFDPAKNEATGFSIDGIGTVGASDIAVDTPNTTVWLTHRFPDAVYRYDWNTKEAIAYEDPGLYRPGLNDLGAKRVPVFVSGDGHVNTLVPDRKTSVIKISTTKYRLRHRVTELTSHELGVTEFKDKVPMNTNCTAPDFLDRLNPP